MIGSYPCRDKRTTELTLRYFEVRWMVRWHVAKASWKRIGETPWRP